MSIPENFNLTEILLSKNKKDPIKGGFILSIKGKMSHKGIMVRKKKITRSDETKKKMRDNGIEMMKKMRKKVNDI